MYIYPVCREDSRLVRVAYDVTRNACSTFTCLRTWVHEVQTKGINMIAEWF